MHGHDDTDIDSVCIVNAAWPAPRALDVIADRLSPCRMRRSEDTTRSLLCRLTQKNSQQVVAGVLQRELRLGAMSSFFGLDKSKNADLKGTDRKEETDAKVDLPCQCC